MSGFMDKAKELAEKAKDVAGDAWEKTKDVAGDVAHKAGDLIDKGKDSAKEGAEKTKDAAGDAADKVKDVTGDSTYNDINFTFPTYIVTQMPVGLIGLLMAAIFAAAMSTIAGELSALSTATVIDFYKVEVPYVKARLR